MGLYYLLFTRPNVYLPTKYHIPMKGKRCMEGHLTRFYTICISSYQMYFIHFYSLEEHVWTCSNPGHMLLYPPQTLFVVGYTVFTLSVRPCVRPSITFCFLNNLESNCWIFIKLCKNIHICKTNTLNKKVRARGQFY